MIAILLAPGCRTAQPEPPRATDRLQSNDAAATSSERPPLDEFEVQAQLMAMVDDYIAVVSEAVYLHLHYDGATPRQRSIAMAFLRNGTGAALDIGVSPNPTTAVLDLLVLASLQRSVLERLWIPTEWPDGGVDQGASGAVEVMRRGEAGLWDQASLVLDESQKTELRTLIAEWIEEHPDQAIVELTRFRDFAQTRNVSSLTSREVAATLLREVSAVARAIDDVRLLGERALWYSSRLPYVLGEQTELTVYRILAQPEIATLPDRLESLEALGVRLTEELDRWPATFDGMLGEAMARVAKERESTLDALTKAVRDERTQTVDDVFEHVASERTEILAAFDERLAESNELRSGLDETLTAGNELALNLERTAAAFERVLAHFEPNPSTSAPPREPVDMKDVREAALAAGDAADRLTATLVQTENVLVRLEDDQTPEAIRSVANDILASATWRLLGVVAFLLVGLAVLRLVPTRKK